MLSWQPNPALYLSPEMVAELALGQDDPLTIAQKYGLTVDEFERLNGESWFGEMVYRQREQLHAEGVTFTAKAKMMAEEMWQDIFQLSKLQDGLRPEHRIDAAKQLTEIAGMKKQAVQGASGPAFAITINLPPNPQGPSARVIEGDARVVKPDPLVIDYDPLPKKPPGYKVPDFKLTNDLVGEVRPAVGISSAPLGRVDPNYAPPATPKRHGFG